MQVFFDEAMLGYSHMPGHPETPERLSHTVSEIRRMQPDFQFTKPTPATVEQLLAVHTRGYVDSIRNWTVRQVDEETPVYKNTFEIASIAAGAAIDALNESVRTKSPTLALVRPPGHHAGASYGGGFCYFNNVAVAVENSGLERVAIVDIDVHHGNGTSDIFYARDDVLYISTHQLGIYPGTGFMGDLGRSNGEGFNLNIPLRAGAGDSTFDRAFDSIILPVLEQFKPDSTIVSIGVDSHYMDPLASLSMSTAGYLACLSSLATASKSVAFILEGGYSVEAMADTLCGLAFLDTKRPPLFKFMDSMDSDCSGSTELDDCVKSFSKFWDLK